jgi:molybdopterin molybdotransferase
VAIAGSASRPVAVQRTAGPADMGPPQPNIPRLTPDEARERILDAVQPLPPVELPILQCLGCVLAGDVVTNRPIPPFPSSGMDGYAVRAADIRGASRSAPVTLPIVGRILIGHPPERAVGAGEAVYIATGAPIPEGADCVVPVEETEEASTDGRETVRLMQEVGAGAHVRPAGQDAQPGDVVVPAGMRLHGPAIGMLSAAGYGTALVHPKVRVAIISTGDELVAPGEKAAYGQIGDSNSYTLYGGVVEAGGVPLHAGIVRDDAEALSKAFTSALSEADVAISSGGVSAGARDVVKQILLGMGTIESYKVAMQPGMPQAFGLVEGKPFFGLPGNPVSTFVSFELFIRPALLKMMGRSDYGRPEVVAVLTQDVSRAPDRTSFVRVHATREGDQWRARPTGPGASNLLGTVVRANALAVVPPGEPTVRAGERVTVRLLGQPPS